ncbi:MAG: hypothetical protein LYZ69_01505 [Nitrososphaerales archaeon]|nr:hypothetical protein [Nitrososphaerales archaeon]
MGSTVAGVKAGVLAGVALFATLAAVNVLLLYAFRTDVMNIVAQGLPSACPLVPKNSTASAESCFTAVVQVDVPLYVFEAFLVSVFITGIFGRVYESVPGSTPAMKGVIVASLMAVVYILLGLTGVTFEYADSMILNILFLVAAMLYGVGLGKLYRRYTGTVEFAVDGESVKILVDGRDFTGKKRTLAKKSSHEVKVEGEAGFREWVVSGGVSVEDNHSFKTTMEVNGDGLLKALVSKKY